MSQIPLDEHGGCNSSGGAGLVVILMFILFVPFLLFSCKKQGEHKQITAEQLKNVRVGDFVKFGIEWFPVRHIYTENNKPTIRIRYGDQILDIDGDYYSIDSIIFAPRDMDQNKWQKMALEYLATH